MKAKRKYWWERPRLSTTEFENSRLKNCTEFKIIDLKFDDGLTNYPTSVNGYVMVRGVARPVVWNRYGACYITGTRFDRFDLISPCIERYETRISALAFVIFCGLVTFILYLTK